MHMSTEPSFEASTRVPRFTSSRQIRNWLSLPTLSLRWLLVLFCLSGCGDAAQDTTPSTPVARRPVTTSTLPLTDADIRTFQAIVRDLPDGRIPEFEPLPQSTIDDRLPAATLVNVCREEYRRMFDPVEQGRRWRDNRKLIAVLQSHGMEPEEFAALLMRLGCAVAAGTVDSRFNLTEASQKAEQQLRATIDQIDELDRRATDGSTAHIGIFQYRQPLVDQMKELVALLEFSRILLSVPEESLAAVARHKEELAVHLPQAGDIRLFERTVDAEAVIVPVEFEQAE